MLINKRERSDKRTNLWRIHCLCSKLHSLFYFFEDSKLLLESIKQDIPQIDLAFKELCHSDLNMKELDAAIKQMSERKAPGQSLTVNLYKLIVSSLSAGPPVLETNV